MATNKNITMKQYNGLDYDTLYPKTTPEQVGAVSYEAQTLTDGQKTQARANIAAAPDGYGLGSETTKTVINWDDAKENGFYRGPAPESSGSGTIIGVTFSNSIAYKVQILYPDSNSNCSVQREMPANGIWGAWEWVNPPMQLGVEYRTTERYLGKPVYVQLMNFGRAPAQGTTKAVAFPENSAAQYLVRAELTYYGITFPKYNSNGTLSMYIYVAQGSGYFYIYSPGEDRSGDGEIHAIIKYTKTTD